MNKPILLALFCLLGSIAAFAQSKFASPELLYTRLQKLSGANAINCGAVDLKQPSDQATDCAQKAFAANKPFYVSYFVQGKDSQVASALAYNGSKLSALEFDSMGWDSVGLKKGDHLTDDGHIMIEPCPRPYAIHKEQSGRLTCLPSPSSTAATP